jgi:hypothetical protein
LDKANTVEIVRIARTKAWALGKFSASELS